MSSYISCCFVIPLEHSFYYLLLQFVKGFTWIPKLNPLSLCSDFLSRGVELLSCTVDEVWWGLGLYYVIEWNFMWRWKFNPVIYKQVKFSPLIRVQVEISTLLFVWRCAMGRETAGTAPTSPVAVSINQHCLRFDSCHVDFRKCQQSPIEVPNRSMLYRECQSLRKFIGIEFFFSYMKEGDVLNFAFTLILLHLWSTFK